MSTTATIKRCYHASQTLFAKPPSQFARMYKRSQSWNRKIKPGRFSRLLTQMGNKFPRKGAIAPTHIDQWLDDMVKPQRSILKEATFADGFKNMRIEELKKLDVQRLYEVRHPKFDQAWELHNENPYYWTGQRLGEYFGVDRDLMWGELLVREMYFAKLNGKPFTFEKILRIFEKSREYPKKMSVRRSFHRERHHSEFDQVVTEDQMYLDLLDVSQRTIPYATHDDELPIWAKVPFQRREMTNLGEIIETMPINLGAATDNLHTSLDHNISILKRPINQVGLGVETPRTKHLFIEIGRNLKDNDRRIRVREADGILRQATQEEVDIAYRVGTFKKVNGAFGGGKQSGRKRKRNLLRKRHYRIEA